MIVSKLAARFEELRKVKVVVEYLRGLSNGATGFWVLESCPAENFEVRSFLHADEVPKSKKVAEQVLAFRDTTNEGISGRDGRVRILHRDADSAVFEVTARILKYLPSAQKRNENHITAGQSLTALEG